MDVRVINGALNRTILEQDGKPVIFGAVVRPSTTSPTRLKVALITPVKGQAASVAEFRLECN